MEKRVLPEVIETPRLVLRKNDLAWAGEMFAAVDSDRERLRRFLPWVVFTKTQSDSESYIRSTIKEWKKLSMFDYGLFEKSCGKYLGNIGVHHIHWTQRQCEIGYWLAGAHEGKGYMSEALKVLEENIFLIGFNRIEIRCDSLNERSSSVPRRNGYHLDGILRESRQEFGKFSDELIYSKLLSDFQKAKESFHDELK